jgi:hypothetical protein
VGHEIESCQGMWWQFKKAQTTSVALLISDEKMNGNLKLPCSLTSPARPNLFKNWDRCYDFKNIFGKKRAEKMHFFYSNEAKLCQNFIVALALGKRHFSQKIVENRRKLSKIAENCRKSLKIVENR